MAEGKRHLMIVTNAIPPCFTGGTPRLLRWCETLPPLGWKITVLGFSEIPFLDKHDRILSDEVTCFPVPFESKISRVVSRFTMRINPTAWPDRFRPHLPRLLTEIRRVFTFDAPDVVMVTTPSHSLLDRDFLEGLQELAPGRIVLEQRDLFSRNDASVHSEVDLTRALEMEQQALPYIDGSIQVSEHHAEIAKSWLGEKPVVCIPNGFIRSRYKDLPRHDPWPGKREDKLRFLFTGMVYGITPMALLIPGFKRAIELRPELKNRLRVIHMGKYQTEALGDWSSLPGVLVTRDQISYSKIPPYLVEADVLMLVIADVQAVAGIPGGKVFEYLGADRPILAVTNGMAARIVEKTQTGLVANPNDPESIAKAVLHIDDLWQRNEAFPMGDPAQRDRWEALNLAKELDRFLRRFAH
ncbi:MAG: glycosyltransferase [Planctomycetaceae bacterium]|nr:glycosyltransferase [Planctomycetaceae bacterium]